MPLWACVKEEREEEERKEVKSLNRFTQPMLVSTMPEPWPGLTQSAGLETITSE